MNYTNFPNHIFNYFSIIFHPTNLQNSIFCRTTFFNNPKSAKKPISYSVLQTYKISYIPTNFNIYT
nr:MAG TPA: hypothetical protein [Caudoviricetes sp.]